MTHTPGPWKTYDGKYGKGVCDISGDKIAWEPHLLYTRSNGGKPQNEADAHLIAAAPELLEAAKAALQVIDHTNYSGAYHALKSATTNATGVKP